MNHLKLEDDRYKWTSEPDEKGKRLRVTVRYWKGTGICLSTCHVEDIAPVGNLPSMESIDLSTVRSMKIMECERKNAGKLKLAAELVDKHLPIVGDSHAVAAHLQSETLRQQEVAR